MSASPAHDVAGIAQRLGDAHGSGGGWTCRCPAHDDHRASLSLSLGDDGRLLWHCHTGCGQREVLEALKANGVMNGDDGGPKRERGRRRVVAVYPYTDENGALLFEKVRYQPKGFAQRRPDGKGGHLHKLGDVRRVLYRLPEIIK